MKSNSKFFSFIHDLFPIVSVSIVGLYTGSYVKKISATPLSSSAYAQQVFQGDNYGGNATLALGQEDLYSSSSPTNKIGSINKEMWVVVDPYSSCWIEAGQKKGEQVKDLSQPDSSSAQTINWSGHFIGYRLFNATNQAWEFHGTSYGNANPTGQHSYQIKLTNASTGEWKIYVDGVQALTLSSFYCRDYLSTKTFLAAKSIGITVGIESKDSSNDFKSGTYISGWQSLNVSDSKWKIISSAQNQDKDVYNGMKSNFSYTASPTPNNKITFTHN